MSLGVVVVVQPKGLESSSPGQRPGCRPCFPLSSEGAKSLFAGKRPAATRGESAAISPRWGLEHKTAFPRAALRLPWAGGFPPLGLNSHDNGRATRHLHPAREQVRSCTRNVTAGCQLPSTSPTAIMSSPTNRKGTHDASLHDARTRPGGRGCDSCECVPLGWTDPSGCRRLSACD